MKTKKMKTNMKIKGVGTTVAPQEYYDYLADLDRIGADGTILLQDGNGGTDYGSAPPSAAGASDCDGAHVRDENGSRVN